MTREKRQRILSRLGGLLFPGAVILAGGMLAACGDDGDDLVEAASELNQALEEAPDVDDPGAKKGEEPDGSGDQGVDLTPEQRDLDVTVFHGGLEYTLDSLRIVDLDAAASPDGEIQHRVQGFELGFDVTASNPGSSSATPAPPVTLRWDNADTGDVIEVRGRSEFRQVPGDATTSGEIQVTLPPDDLPLYDGESARLVLGQPDSNPAVAAFGEAAETVDRFPVPVDLDQFDVLDANGVLVTVTSAEVRWDDPDGVHYPDGQALLEIAYTIENPTEGQSCSARQTGAWGLKLPNGDSIVDLGVSERCVASGQTETDVFTGFVIDGHEVTGDYVISHERRDLARENVSDETTFTIDHMDGLPAAERDTR